LSLLLGCIVWQAFGGILIIGVGGHSGPKRREGRREGGSEGGRNE